jgi:hypothetical protein
MNVWYLFIIKKYTIVLSQVQVFEIIFYIDKIMTTSTRTKVHT